MITTFTTAIRFVNFLRITATLILLGIFSEQSFAQTLPHPDHIVILIEENQPSHDIFGLQVIGNAAAPYITALVTDTDAANFSAM